MKNCPYSISATALMFSYLAFTQEPEYLTATQEPVYLTATQTFTIQQKSDIFITEFSVPYRGNLNWFIGKTNASPAEYKIAVYTSTLDEFYTKPYYNQPDVYIAQDGSFTFPVATGRIDGIAQSFASVFVVPYYYQIPIAEGLSEVPQEVQDVAVYSIHLNR